MEVTVVGSCNVDLISYVSRLPKPGETIQGTKFVMGQGGKGANQCVMSSKLGAKTAMIAKVGKDTFGDGFVKAFQDLGVCTDHVSRTDQAMTGAAPINVEDSGQNSIIIIPGANLLLTEDDLKAAEDIIASSKVMICQLEIEPSITLAALKIGRKHGVKTILNPAPAISLDKSFFENADIFCPNETESEILTGINVTSVDNAIQAAYALQKLGCKDVIITLGEMGCLVAEFNSEKTVHVTAPLVQAVDTTGAGDAFIGSLAFYLATMPDLGLVESAQRAVQIASVSVQRLGTQTSMPASDLTRQDWDTMDVTVVGSCIVDLIRYVSRLPKHGETIQGTKFVMGQGGKGANQCVMSSKLGAKTAMIAKVGKDTFGDGFLNAFQDFGISTDHVSRTCDALTGAGHINVEDSGQNSIIIIPGANLLLNEDDLKAAEDIIASSKVMICQLEIEPSITLAALKMGRKHAVRTILNPAPAISLDKSFFENTDIICPNETESEILTGINVTSVDHALQAAHALQKLGCKDVIITLGEMGCLVAESNSEKTVHVSAPIIHAIDTTGAGDAFIGSLAFYLATMPDLGLVESAWRAVQIASVSVQRLGTQTSMPVRSELPDILFSKIVVQ